MSSWRRHAKDEADKAVERAETGFAFDLTDDERRIIEGELMDDSLFVELALALHRLDNAERSESRHTGRNRRGEEVSVLHAHDDVEALVDSLVIKHAREVVDREGSE